MADIKQIKVGSTNYTINADKLDGYHSSSFSLTSHTHDFSDINSRGEAKYLHTIELATTPSFSSIFGRITFQLVSTAATPYTTLGQLESALVPYADTYYPAMGFQSTRRPSSTSQGLTKHFITFYINTNGAITLPYCYIDNHTYCIEAGTATDYFYPVSDIVAQIN